MRERCRGDDDLRVGCVDESGDGSFDVLERSPLGRRRCILYELLTEEHVGNKIKQNMEVQCSPGPPSPPRAQCS